MFFLFTPQFIFIYNKRRIVADDYRMIFLSHWLRLFGENFEVTKKLFFLGGTVQSVKTV